VPIAVDMIDKHFLIKFLKFGIVGGSGVLVDFGITWFMRERLKINQYTSNTTGFCCAVVSNYILNRLWTFESHNNNVPLEFGKFVLVSVVGLSLNNLIIYLLNERFGLNFYLAKGIATGIVMIWNFFANLYFTFG
jgi:putative flippase GtrA